jgi:hypothetical protein
MMKKSALVVFFIFAAAALAGCDLHSPQGALGSAYHAVEKNDLDGFREALTGEALASYGSDQGLKQLQAEIAPFDHLKLENMLSSTVIRNPNGRGILRVYTVDVLGDRKFARGVMKNLRVFNATVICSEESVFVHGEPRNGTQDRTINEVLCKISNLN